MQRVKGKKYYVRKLLIPNILGQDPSESNSKEEKTQRINGERRVEDYTGMDFKDLLIIYCLLIA